MVPEFDAGRLRAGAGTDQRPRQDAVRLSHHQADRQEGRARRRPLDEVRQQLSEQLSTERAQAQAADLATTLAKRDQQAGRSRQGGQGAGPDGAGIGLLRARRADPRPRRRRRRWRPARSQMKPGEVAGPLRTGARLRVRDADRQAGALRAEARRSEGPRARRSRSSRRRASSAGRKRRRSPAKLKAAPDFEKAAKAAGVEAEDDRAHRARLADARSRRRARRSTRRRSSCRSGAVSDPITTDNGTAIVKVLEKQEVTPDELAANEGHVPRGAARPSAATASSAPTWRRRSRR